MERKHGLRVVIQYVSCALLKSIFIDNSFSGNMYWDIYQNGNHHVYDKSAFHE
jgi:hypothetical protein